MNTETKRHIPASYLVLFKDNKTLMLRRANTGYEDGNYSLVAGHVEENESFIQCIIREAKEESNVIVKEEDLYMAHTMHRKSPDDSITNQRIDTFFVAKKWEGEITNMEPHKCDDLSWFDIDDIPENTIPYIKIALEHIKNNVVYSEIGWK